MRYLLRSAVKRQRRDILFTKEVGAILENNEVSKGTKKDGLRIALYCVAVAGVVVAAVVFLAGLPLSAQDVISWLRTVLVARTLLYVYSGVYFVLGVVSLVRWLTSGEREYGVDVAIFVIASFVCVVFLNIV